MNSINRNSGLDILKALCAFMVVFVHVNNGNTISIYISSLCRIAVPIFFMITGYFYQNTVNNNRQLIQIKKIVKLIAVANIFYFIFYGIIYCLNGHFIEWIKNIFTIKNIIDLVLFNVNPMLHRLWYLNAILYCLIIFYFVNKMNKIEFVCKISPLLIIIGLIIGPYCNALFNISLSEKFCRNFLFMGVPYFSLGYYINRNNINKKNKYIYVLLFFIAFNIFEVYYLSKYNKLTNIECFISTPFIAISMFIIFKEFISSNKVLVSISNIGRKHSENIYLYHRFEEYILLKAFSTISNLSFIASIIIYIGSIVISIIVNAIEKRIKNVV